MYTYSRLAARESCHTDPLRLLPKSMVQVLVWASHRSSKNKWLPWRGMSLFYRWKRQHKGCTSHTYSIKHTHMYVRTYIHAHTVTQSICVHTTCNAQWTQTHLGHHPDCSLHLNGQGGASEVAIKLLWQASYPSSIASGGRSSKHQFNMCRLDPQWWDHLPTAGVCYHTTMNWEQSRLQVASCTLGQRRGCQWPATVQSSY